MGQFFSDTCALRLQAVVQRMLKARVAQLCREECGAEEEITALGKDVLSAVSASCLVFINLLSR